MVVWNFTSDLVFASDPYAELSRIVRRSSFRLRNLERPEWNRTNCIRLAVDCLIKSAHVRLIRVR